MSESPLLQLSRVSKRFGSTQALREISLTVRPGERVALLGPSGAGKSTLLGILNTSLRPDSGAYEWMGADVESLSQKKLVALRRAIGTIYQRFHLTENLAVIHNLNAGRMALWSFTHALFSLVSPREIEASRKILESVGIPEKLFSRTGDLSGGQMQRVAIARALAQNPELILADEITASVDPERARRVMDLIVRLSKEKPISVMLQPILLNGHFLTEGSCRLATRSRKWQSIKYNFKKVFPCPIFGMSTAQSTSVRKS